MSILKQLLTAVETSKRCWQDALGEVQLAINCTTNRTTKASPLELLIEKVARPLNLLTLDENEKIVDLTEIRLEADKNIQNNAAYEKNKFDCNKIKPVKFEIGDFVLLKSEERHQTKLDPKYRGPFRIIEVCQNDRYVLKSLNSNRKYKYSSEWLRKLPEGKVPEELDIVLEEQNVDEEDDVLEGVERDVIEDGMLEGVERDVIEDVEPESVEKDVGI